MAIMALAMLFGVALAGMMGGTDAPEVGSDASEKYTGTDNDDLFAAGAGNDLVIGNEGADTLEGGDGADWLIGGSGSDSLSGDDGLDVLIGGTGHDILHGNGGDDFVEAAGITNESVLNTSVASTTSLSGIRFEYDLPNSSDEGDTIDLGEGNDTVVLGADDTLIAGEGEDVISLGDWGENGGAARILDFDAEEDVLLYTYLESAGEPDVALSYDEEEDGTALIVDGKVVAFLHGANTSMTPGDIRLVSYR